MKKVVVLATGGTIAGAGEPGKNVGYKSGAIEAADLVAAVPGLAQVAQVSVEQVCNINSDDVTSAIWLRLLSRIKELAVKPDVDGVVIMHGTDTMEETACFLALTLDVQKPVVLTGAMRPATAAEPDGPTNLLLAVKVAVGSVAAVAGGTASGGRVLLAFAGKVMDGLSAQKIHANALDAFVGMPVGVGALPHFELDGVAELPKVAVLYFNAEADPAQVAFAAGRSEGIVVAGAGAGEFSEAWIAEIKKCVSGPGKRVPVVVSTRISNGEVVPEQLLVPGTVAAYALPPAKAAVLLRLALTQTQNPGSIQKFFKKFVV